MSVSSWSRNKMPIFTDLQKLNLETRHFLSGLVHNGWFDIKDLFPLLDRETRTCGKMNQSSGNQRFAYQQPVRQVPPGQSQPVYFQAQAPPGQYAQQPVGQVVQQVQLVQPAAAAQEPTLPKTTDYWNSALIAERVVEFVSCCSFFQQIDARISCHLFIWKIVYWARRIQLFLIFEENESLVLWSITIQFWEQSLNWPLQPKKPPGTEKPTL